MTLITMQADVARTPRVMQIEGMFDIAAAQVSSTAVQDNIPDLDDFDWSIGVIVGPSGCGKSTIARHRFAVVDVANDWPADASIVDGFPDEMSVRDVSMMLSSVGFASPPTWLRPYRTLSNGEKFRADMALLMARSDDLVVVDEYTSVVDRTVAQIGSAAIAKTVRRSGQRFVAVTCHYDVIPWLEPDWVYEPASGTFSKECLHQRPEIHANIIRCDSTAWATFARHHYLDHNCNRAAHAYVALVDGMPACFVAMLPLPHGKVKQGWRVSRIVTLPDYQGIGIGRHMLDTIAGAYRHAGKDPRITTSHPAMIAALNRSGTWAMTRGHSRIGHEGRKSKLIGMASSQRRITASFRYVGPPDPDAYAVTPFAGNG